MRKAKPPKAKEPIKLRFKQLANGNQSIFLEQYISYSIDENGKQKNQKKYEFLNLYLIPEQTPADKITNANTLQDAESIRTLRKAALVKNQTGLTTRKKTKVNLLKNVSDFANKALSDTNNKRSEYYTYKSLEYHLKAYRGEHITFNEIDKDFINGFIAYLKTAKNGNFEGQKIQPNISANTAHKLYAKFTTIIRAALYEEIISTNPLDKIDRKTTPKTKPSKREYLTIDEIKKLITTDCKRSEIKNAFLFCCLVGIRFSNVKNITWGDIKFNKSGATLSYKQIKVDTFETLSISEEALKFLPNDNERKPENKIFPLPKTETVNDTLRNWIKTAGIRKTITFHSSRHTAATLQLSLGTPIETVSKLLGHGKISTTQIYAKIIDKNKVEAVNLQNGIFD
jgi:integrase